MGKVIKVKFYNPKTEERKHNLKQLKKLIEQYCPNENYMLKI